MIDDENEAVSRSIYVRHMRKWLDKFKPNQIHVISGEQVMGTIKVQWKLEIAEKSVTKVYSSKMIFSAFFLLNWFPPICQPLITLINQLFLQLVRNPWTELRKVENFLGLPREISKNNFQFVPSKGFYCLKVKTGAQQERHQGIKLSEQVK